MTQKRCPTCRRNFHDTKGQDLCNFCLSQNQIAIIGTYYDNWLEANKEAKGKMIMSCGKGYVVFDGKQLSAPDLN